MDPLTTLKILHILAIALLLLGAVGLAAQTWRAHRRGDSGFSRRLLQRPLLFVWLLMVLCVVSLPFTGWWLVHRVGWPLGQAWILGSSILYSLGLFSLWWLVARLNRLRTGATVGARYTLILAAFSGMCFLGIALLMVFRPA